MSEKEKKHQQAQKFRQELQTSLGRVRAIEALASKEHFDEQDILKLKILSQKKYSDCKDVYPLLVLNLREKGMNEEANIFQKIWISC